MIIRIYESQTLTKPILCKCKCKFKVENVIQIKSGVTLNVNMSTKIQENMCVTKIIFGILVHVLVKMVHI